MNSTQFQISSDSRFLTSDIDLIRDYENLYGTTGSPDYRPVDIHKNINILQYTIGKNKLRNGTYYVRTRHRDQNIEWSEWSGSVRFTVKGSVSGITGISSPKKVYKLNEEIIVNYQFGPGNAKDWIGIYKNGQIPGSVTSTDWHYTYSSSGTLNLRVAEAGRYFIAFFENDGYVELAERISVYVGEVPVLSMSKAGYDAGEGILVSYSGAPAFSKDWLGIYKLNDIPGVVGSTSWTYTSGVSGTVDFAGLPAGYYFICYFLEDGYTEACDRIIFSAGSDLATVKADQSSYIKGQTINIDFDNGPGTLKDWIGLFRQDAPPGTPPLVDRHFIENLRSGSLSFEVSPDPGEYFIAMYINNSSICISNKAVIKIETGSSALSQQTINDEVTLYPSPSTGRFRIKISGLQAGNIFLKILSSVGVIVWEKRLPARNSIYSEEIDLSGAQAGIYIVSLQTENRLFTKRLVLK
jgi:hypothetical protein